MKERIVIIVIIAIVILFCTPFLKNINYVNSNEDWKQIYSYYAAARKTILSQHQFPLRSPYFGGGYPLIANPQDGSLSPLMLFVLLFGEVVGTKIICLLAYILAALGMYCLVRYVLKYNIAGALFSSLSLSLCGWLPNQLYDGNFTKIYYYFVPLLLFFFLKSNDDKRYLFFSSLLASIILFQAGLSFLACILFLFLFALLQTKIKKVEGRIKVESEYVRAFTVLVIMTLLISAVKVLPLLQLLRIGTRVINYSQYRNLSEYYYYSLQTFLPALFQRHYLGAGAIYLGYLPVIFCVFSVIISWRRLAKYFMFLLVIIFLCFAPNAPIDFFRTIWHLPLFCHMIKPSKYFSFFIVFLICLMGGYFFVWLERLHLKKNIKALLALILITYSVLNLFLTNIDFHKGMFDTPFLSIKEFPQFSQAKIINREKEWQAGFIQYDLLYRNIGLINWYGDIYLAQNPVPKYLIDLETKERTQFPLDYTLTTNPSYRGEVYFLSGNNKAHFKYFSPNRIIVSVDVVDSTPLIINQNYHYYWKANIGKLGENDGLLSISSLPKGSYEIELDYRPFSFYLGLGISIATLIIFIVGCVLARKSYCRLRI